MNSEDIRKRWENERTFEQVQKEITKDICYLFKRVKSQDEVVENIIVNPSAFNIMRIYLKDIMDLVGQYSVIKQGIFGFLWGAIVWVDSSVDRVFVESENFKCYYNDDGESVLEKVYDVESQHSGFGKMGFVK